MSDLFKINSSNDPLVSELDLGSTPHIASTKSNNGVIQYVNLPPTNPKNVLTVNRGGSVGGAFYQKQPFLATPVDVRILIPKFEINQYIGMFLSTILRKEKYRFNYTRKMGTARLEKSQIKLPATPKGKPDWQFMENCVESVMKKVKPLSKEPILNEKIKLDVSRWEDFYIGNLFKIERGKEIVSEVERGNINPISSSDIFNGLNKKIKKGRKIFTGNQITIANNGSVGACFYHSEILYTASDVFVLTNNELNIYSSLFIVTVIRNENYRFSYGKKWGLAKMKSHKIKLPATPQGDPD